MSQGLSHPSRKTSPYATHLGFSLTLLGAALLAGCDDAQSSEFFEEVDATAQAATVSVHDSAVNLCNQDPRVWSGLVPLNVCVGSKVFFEETFAGNGRTCGSCHPGSNNLTIDGSFLSTLAATDPLFINENPALPLSTLETSALRGKGLILENVDGFDNLAQKFVLRSVPHLFSMAVSIARDPADGTSASFTERTGWSGDGVDGGSLRDFASGAIKQHFPKDLGRTPGTSFRNATNAELDRLLDFQLSIGRKADVNLDNVQLTDPFAEQGRLDFMDPQVGRCNECHENAGANSKKTKKNTNFATGSEIFSADFLDIRPQIEGVSIFDGGFGGQGLSTPNVRASGFGNVDGFGDNSFNTPSLIEAADTGPHFHHNNANSDVSNATGLPGAVAFYGTSAFNDSVAGQALIAEFGTPVTLPGNAIVNISSFLRAINVAFNLDIAKQRLNASKLLNTQYWDYRIDLQMNLLSAATREVTDALNVMRAFDGPPIGLDQQGNLEAALTKLEEARSSGSAATRIQRTQEALALVQTVRTSLGTGLTFDLGPGTLMF